MRLSVFITVVACLGLAVADKSYNKAAKPSKSASDEPLPSELPLKTTAAATTTSSEIPFDCSKQPDGFYSNPDEPCSPIFYGCSGGVASEMECAESSFFDELSGSCLEKEFVVACGGQSTTVKPFVPVVSDAPPFAFDCSKKDDGPYPNPIDRCSDIYVDCVAYMPIYRKCASKMMFDELSEKCLDKEFVEACGGMSTTTIATTTVLSDEAIQCTTEIDGFYPNPKQACSSVFYACSGGFTRRMECTEGTYYDTLSSLCMEKDFVVACGGEPTTLPPFVPVVSDEPPFHFDCSNKDDGDYAHPSEKCSALYVSCTGQSAVYRQCAEDLKFDDISNECHEDRWVAACGGETTTRLPETRRTRQYSGRPSVTPIPEITTAASPTEETESTEIPSKNTKSYTRRAKTSTPAAAPIETSATTLSKKTKSITRGYRTTTAAAPTELPTTIETTLSSKSYMTRRRLTTKAAAPTEETTETTTTLMPSTKAKKPYVTRRTTTRAAAPIETTTTELPSTTGKYTARRRTTTTQATTEATEQPTTDDGTY